MSDAHIPSTLRAQAASEASPTRFPTHTYQSTLRAPAASEGSPTRFPTHTHRPPFERRRQSEASPTPCPTHTYQAPFVVSICFYSYAVPPYLLEEPLLAYTTELALLSKFFVKIVYPRRIKTIPVHVCLLL